MLPMALSIGVAYELFWHLTPKKLEPFIRAHQLKRQEKSENMWIMGQYMMGALNATVCNMIPFTNRKKAEKYLEEPIRMIPYTKEELEKKQAEKELENQKTLNRTVEILRNMSKKNKS